MPPRCCSGRTSTPCRTPGATTARSECSPASRGRRRAAARARGSRLRSRSWPSPTRRAPASAPRSWAARCSPGSFDEATLGRVRLGRRVARGGRARVRRRPRRAGRGRRARRGRWSATRSCTSSRARCSRRARLPLGWSSGHRGPDAGGGPLRGHSGPCRHGPDGAPPRRALRGRPADRRGGGARPRHAGPGRHRRRHHRGAGRPERDPGAGAARPGRAPPRGHAAAPGGRPPARARRRDRVGARDRARLGAASRAGRGPLRSGAHRADVPGASRTWASQPNALASGAGHDAATMARRRARGDAVRALRRAA